MAQQRIVFQDFWESECVLTRQQVVDIVDVLLDKKDNRPFKIFGTMHEEYRGRPTLGLHMYDWFFGSGHEIYMAPKKIKKSFEAGRPTGGNRIAPNIQLAFGMILAHEIQHANQTNDRGTNDKAFFGKERSRYMTRPCERDARQFADDNIKIVAGILGITLKTEKFVEVPPDEVTFVAECLAEASEVSQADIREELRMSGINNAVTFQQVKTMLTSWGVQLR